MLVVCRQIKYEYTSEKESKINVKCKGMDGCVRGEKENKRNIEVYRNGRVCERVGELGEMKRDVEGYRYGCVRGVMGRE